MVFPPTPRAPQVVVGLTAALLSLGVASSANSPPVAVFKTRPQAVDGVISGPAPLDVWFNMCQSYDPDPGDELKFTYDFDGDGLIDYYGHCRQKHRYAAPDTCLDATVCVWDRQPYPDHRLCQTYSVCTSGAPSPSPAPTPQPTPTPDILPFTYDLYSFTASAGTSVDVIVDTVAPSTAFDPWACISTTPQGCVLMDDTVVEFGDDDQPCTFPPPNYECPAFTATLLTSGVYYLLVSDSAEDDFAGDVGIYSLQVTGDNAIGPLVRLADNADDSTIPRGAWAPKARRGHAPVPPPPLSSPAGPPAATGSSPIAPGMTGTPPAAPDATRPSPAAPARPVPADAGIGAGAPTESVSAAAAASIGTAGRRPEAVFHTEPPASASGRITGGASFDVTFDLCASKKVGSARALTFVFDFDGDGAADGSGSCRQIRHYEFEPRARCVKSVACVGDGEKAHQTCRTFTICGAPGSTTPR